MARDTWADKEQIIEFWYQPDANAGNAFFQHWNRSVMCSRLPRVTKVADTLTVAHLRGLLTSFKHRFTNAITKGLNSKIQSIKADAPGFRRFENHHARILFICGKHNGLPQVSSTVTHSIP